MALSNTGFPVELFSKVALYLDYKTIRALEQFKPAADLLTSGQYWNGRTLKIKCREDLRIMLGDKNARNAYRIDLSATEIDDTDLSFVAQHLEKLEVLDISHNPDLTDEGVEAVLQKHGPYLRKIDLSRLFRLTNLTLEAINQHCCSLEELSLNGCMFSAAGLRKLSSGRSSLRKLSISKSHLIDTRERPIIVQGMERLGILKMNHLDGLEPYQVQAVIQECPKLKSIEIIGCPEITLRTVRQLSSLNKRISISHDARLEDHTIDSVRRFLLGLVAQ
jgi:hypothetical protein